MTKEELLAYEYGRTFDPSGVPAGYPVAVCFDNRMHALVTEARSERGFKRNERNMAAWYSGQAQRKE